MLPQTIFYQTKIVPPLENNYERYRSAVHCEEINNLLLFFLSETANKLPGIGNSIKEWEIMKIFRKWLRWKEKLVYLRKRKIDWNNQLSGINVYKYKLFALNKLNLIKKKTPINLINIVATQVKAIWIIKEEIRLS